MQVRLLGPVEVVVNGTPLPLGPPQERSLLTLLAGHAGREVSRCQIIDAIWGDRPPATVTSSVYTYVAGLRKRLEPTRPSRAPSGVLRSSRSGYTLRVDPADVDALVFEEHLSAAKASRSRGEAEQALGRFAQALRMWPDALPKWHVQPLSGAPGPYAVRERDRLNELRHSTVEDWADLLLSMDRADEAVGELTTLCRILPLRERARSLLVLALYRCGRQAEALSEFHDARRTLDRELGIEPCEQLRILHEQILKADPELLTIRTRAEPRRRDVPVAPAQLPRVLPTFVGRNEELKRIQGFADSWEAGLANGVIQVTGPEGVGKSALVMHFAHTQVQRFPEGQLYVDLGAPGGGAAPRAPTEILADVIAELGWTGELPATLERRSALYRTLLSGRRMLIVLKDASSADDVRALLPGCHSCLVIITSHAEMTSLTVREQALCMHLGALPADDAVRLVEKALDGRHAPDVQLVRDLARTRDLLPSTLVDAVESITAHSARSLPDRRDTAFQRRDHGPRWGE